MEKIVDENSFWDDILVDPKIADPLQRIRDKEHDKGFQRFLLVRALNYAYDEIKSFSLTYPLYRILFLLSPYSWRDFLLFKDSGKAYKYIFALFLYLPTALLILFYKFLICIFDFVCSLHLVVQLLLFLFFFILFFV